MADVTQKQTGALGANNTQIAYQNNYYGISYADAVDISTRVFNDNFPKLQKEAFILVEQRLQEFNNKLFEKLIQQNLTDFGAFGDPDVQYVLYEAQKEYARKGNEELCQLLCDIISERIKVNKQNILQFTLNEAIKVAPNLNQMHLDMLSLSFFIKYTTDPDINCLEDLASYLKKALPFCHIDAVSNSDYMHLNYCGCGQLLAGEKLGNLMFKNYPGFFKADNPMHIINPFNDEEEININGEQISLRDYILKRFPELTDIFNSYNTYNLYSLSLTSVGTMLGMINYCRKTGDKLDYSIWLT